MIFNANRRQYLNNLQLSRMLAKVSRPLRLTNVRTKDIDYFKNRIDTILNPKTFIGMLLGNPKNKIPLENHRIYHQKTTLLHRSPQQLS